MYDFKTRIHDEIALQGLIQAIDEQRPFSFVRFGDGEAMFLGYPEFSDRSQLNQILWTWFGPRTWEDAELQVLRSEGIEAFRTADIIGAPGFASVRQFGTCNRVLRRLVFPWVDHVPICSASFPIYLQKHDRFDVLFERVKEVNLITCRDVATLLSEKYGVTTNSTYIVPGESAWSEETTQNHYPAVFERLRTSLSVPHRGAVFLVGAGICGKVYCSWLKKLGAIAIDLGSIFDLWAGKGTRAYMSQSDAYENLLLQMPSRQESTEAHFDLARHHTNRQEFEAAHASLDIALSINKDYYPAHVLRAKLFEHTGNVDGALAQLEMALAGSSDPAVLIQKGDLLHKLSTAAEAKECYAMAENRLRDLLNSGITAPPIYDQLCSVLEKQNKIDEAIAAALDKADDDYHNDSAHFHAALLLFRQGYQQEGIDKLRVAVDVSGGDPRYHHHLGNLLSEAGRYEEAEKEHRLAVAINPAVPEWHFHLSVVSQRLNLREQAIQSAKAAVQLDPSNLAYSRQLSALSSPSNACNVATVV